MYGITESHYELDLDGGAILRATVVIPDEAAWPAPTVLFCHGFKGFKDWGPWPWLTRELASRGFVVHRFNFSHSGVGAALDRYDEPDRFAINTYGREVDDLHSWVAGVNDAPVPSAATNGRLGLVGHSRGGLVSILFGSEWDGVETIVTLGSPGFSDRFPEEVKAQWRERGSMDIVNQRTGEVLPLCVSVLEDFEKHRDRYDLAAAARRRAVPTLVVHGDADQSVPVEEAHALFASLDRSRRQLEIIPGAGHTFETVHPFEGPTEALNELLGHTAGWLERHLR